MLHHVSKSRMQFVILESSESSFYYLSLAVQSVSHSLLPRGYEDEPSTKLDLDCAKEYWLHLPAVYLKSSSPAHTSDVRPHCIFSKLYYPALEGSICTHVPIVAIRLELHIVSKVFLPCVGHKFVRVYSRKTG